MSSIRIPPKIIAKGIANYYGIQENEIFNRSRKRVIKDRRFIFFSLLREYNGVAISLEEAGKFCKTQYGIKHFDHATVLHGCRRVQEYLATEAEYREVYKDIRLIVEKLNSQRVEFMDLSEKKRTAILAIMDTRTDEELEALVNMPI